MHGKKQKQTKKVGIQKYLLKTFAVDWIQISFSNPVFKLAVTDSLAKCCFLFCFLRQAIIHVTCHTLLFLGVPSSLFRVLTSRYRHVGNSAMMHPQREFTLMHEALFLS